MLRHGRIGGRTLATNSGMAAAMEAVGAQQREIAQSRMSWDDMAWMRDRWKGHCSIKGVTEPEDAEKAVAIGADGVVVSNHGGRQLASPAARWTPCRTSRRPWAAGRKSCWMAACAGAATW